MVLVAVITHGDRHRNREKKRRCDASEKCFRYDYITIDAGAAGSSVASKLVHVAELVIENILLIGIVHHILQSTTCQTIFHC